MTVSDPLQIAVEELLVEAERHQADPLLPKGGKGVSFLPFSGWELRWVGGGSRTHWQIIDPDGTLYWEPYCGAQLAAFRFAFCALEGECPAGLTAKSRGVPPLVYEVGHLIYRLIRAQNSKRRSE